MPPAVDHEARRSDDIHRLVGQRLAGQFAGGEQQIGKQDQRGPGPTGDFNRDFNSAQAASLRST